MCRYNKTKVQDQRHEELASVLKFPRQEIQNIGREVAT
jgi:hypothetical protein